jgi:hypothetical protein
MAGTIIADFIRTDANQLSLNVGNTTFATINASGFFSNTGTQLIAANGKVSGASLVSGSIPSSAFATAANTIPRSSMTSGAVLQVVSSTTLTQFTSTTTTFADIGLTATITPTSSSSRILIFGSFGDTSSQNQTSPAGNKLILFRNSTQIGGGQFANQWNYAGTTNHMISSGGLVYVDSPSSTSALTYKFQGATQSTGRTMEFMRDGTIGSIILMEIA